jgi:hypothetical protein
MRPGIFAGESSLRLYGSHGSRGEPRNILRPASTAGGLPEKQLFSRISGCSSKPRTCEDTQCSHISRKSMGAPGSEVTGAPGPVRFPFRPPSQIENHDLRRRFLCSYSQRHGETCSISEPISGKATRADCSCLRRLHRLSYHPSMTYHPSRWAIPTPPHFGSPLALTLAFVTAFVSCNRPGGRCGKAPGPVNQKIEPINVNGRFGDDL